MSLGHSSTATTAILSEIAAEVTPGVGALHLRHLFRSPGGDDRPTAIAPLFVLWFGYGIWSKVLVTVLITFFPITITVYDGLRSAKTEMAELLQTYGATRKDIFLKIKVPCALPYFFSAIKMAVPMSIIGAAIGEWLGAKSGLGYFSRRMMTQLDGAGVFAPIVLLSAAAILAVAVVGLLERRFVRWRGES